MKWFSLLLLFFNSVIWSESKAQRLIYDETIPVEKIRVVLEQTQGGTVSEMLSDLEYIPLQTFKGDLIDRISDLAIIDDRVGVLTSYSSGGQFYLFSLAGKLLKKISKIDGFKPFHKENKALFQDIVAKDGKFVLSNYTFRATVDTEGNILDTLTEQRKIVEDEDGQPVRGQIDIAPGLTYYYYGITNGNKRKRHDVLALNDSVLMKFNPQDTNRTNFSLVNTPLSKVKDEKAYLTIFQKTLIFELGTQGIDKIYDVVFPFRNTLTEEEKLRHTNWEGFLKYLQEHNSKVLEVGRTMRYQDYLIFYVARFRDPMWLAYNTETKETYGLSNIIPDASNDYLPFFDFNNLFVDGDYIYSFIYPNHLMLGKNKSLDERHTMSKATADLAKYNNPILVRFKLK